jgi:hypothetical protein
MQQQLNFPDWTSDVASLDNGYILLNNNYQSHTQPALFIAANVMSEISYIIKNRKDEIAMFLPTIELNDGFPHFMAFDYLIPKQSVTSTLASIDGPDMIELTNSIKHYYPNNGMHKHLTHLHLHPQMSASWSGTDLKQQNSKGELGFESDYRIYLVINTDNQIKATFVQYKPVHHRFDDMAIGIYVKGKYAPVELTKERKDEINALVNCKCAQQVHTYTVPEYTYTRKDWWEADPLPNIPNIMRTLGKVPPSPIPDPVLLNKLHPTLKTEKRNEAARRLTTLMPANEKKIPAFIKNFNDAVTEGYFDDMPLDRDELEEILDV